MSMVALSDIICTNENEAEFITKISQNTMEDAEKAAAQMVTMGPEHAIITLGAKGVVLASKGKEEIEHIPVKKVKAVDTTTQKRKVHALGPFEYDKELATASVDRLAYFLVHEGLSVPDAIRKAAGIAALSVQRKGTQSSYWVPGQKIEL
ncbi:hypothetical protein OSTOST_11500 [Ostertagia ostertagi]